MCYEKIYTLEQYFYILAVVIDLGKTPSKKGKGTMDV